MELQAHLLLIAFDFSHTAFCLRAVNESGSPSLRLEQDVELFEDNAFEYIRRDVEGSDTDTRRRVSCDLVRGLCRNYEAQALHAKRTRHSMALFETRPYRAISTPLDHTDEA